MPRSVGNVVMISTKGIFDLRVFRFLVKERHNPREDLIPHVVARSAGRCPFEFLRKLLPLLDDLGSGGLAGRHLDFDHTELTRRGRARRRGRRVRGFRGCRRRWRARVIGRLLRGKTLAAWGSTFLAVFAGGIRVGLVIDTLQVVSPTSYRGEIPLFYDGDSLRI
jgi:hypothetical protein